jgi:hypothetical protein
MRGPCPSGKTKRRSIREAENAARTIARASYRARKLMPSLYAYRCPECGRLHLTKRSTFAGQPNTLIFAAPPEALQRWAFPPGGGV